MAINILDTLISGLDDRFTSPFSAYLGESTQDVHSALGLMGPELSDALVQQGATVEGAARLLEALAIPEIDARSLEDVAGLFSGDARIESLVRGGENVAGSVLGDKVPAVARMVASRTGLTPASSLKLGYLLVALMSGVVRKLAGDQGLDAAGLMHLLVAQTGFGEGAADPLVTGSGGAAPAVAAAAGAPAPSALRRLLPFLFAVVALATAVFALRSCGAGGRSAVEARTPAAATLSPRAADPAHKPPDVVAALPAQVYFAVGSAALSEEARQTVGRVAAVLKTEDRAVTVTGYTDGTGSVALNRRLAKRRALAIKSALAAAGIPAARINIKPSLAVGDTTIGIDPDAAARRVEIAAER